MRRGAVGTADLWEYASRHHPVYERPREDTRWKAPLEGFRAAGYVPWRVSPRVTTREPLLMRMEGHPSVDLHRKGPEGGTVQTVRLRTTTGVDLSENDLAPLKQIARQWWEFLKQMSQGPHSLDDLRRMGHPYGYPHNRGQSRWERIGAPRGHGHLFKRGWAVKGVRGFVPPLTVINRQTGDLEKSWRWGISRAGDGIAVNWWNPMPYSFYLAHGTTKMRAHGPWAEAADRYLPELQRAWVNALRGAQRRDRAMAAQFGEDYTEQEPTDDERGSYPGPSV